jgi:hypothetical protein
MGKVVGEIPHFKTAGAPASLIIAAKLQRSSQPAGMYVRASVEIATITG